MNEVLSFSDVAVVGNKIACAREKERSCTTVTDASTKQKRPRTKKGGKLRLDLEPMLCPKN